MKNQISNYKSSMKKNYPVINDIEYVAAGIVSKFLTKARRGRPTAFKPIDSVQINGVKYFQVDPKLLSRIKDSV